MSSTPPRIEPVILEGDTIRHEPLATEHVPGLWAAGRDPAIWTWLPSVIRSEEEMAVAVQSSMVMAETGNFLFFVTIDRESGETIGSTAYLNADLANRRVEVGFTWITPRWQRSHVNTESKLLMLTHAFETLRCVRVELKTDAKNLASRAAIERIGALREGRFRKHMMRPDGSHRDSIYYSIVDTEWPAMEVRLRGMLTAHPAVRCLDSKASG